MMDMRENVEAINPTLAKTIWKGHQPKKVKFFLWEIAHKAIRTSENLQKRMPYISLSPNWCPLCKKENKSQSHLFMLCTYAQNIWTTILNIFGWHLTFPREVKDFLDMALMYHPFKNPKALSWKNLIMTFFWNMWKERNQRIFAEKTQTCAKLFNIVVYQAKSWCKLSNIFTSYSHTSLIANWEGLL